MPTDAKVGNPRPGNPPHPKGKPMGIPKWGWIVGIALGLVIGYIVLKKQGSSSSSDTSSGSGSSPLGNSDTGSGGGASSGSATDPNVLAAQGLTHTDSSDPGAVDGQGDSSITTNPGAVLPNPAAAGIPAQSPQNEAPIGGSGTQTVSSQSGNVTTISKPAGSNVNRPGLQM